jgi:hypothetical protein
LTGTQVALLVVSETGIVYTFTTPKFQPLVTTAEGQDVIQVCRSQSRFISRSAIDVSQAYLNAPEPHTAEIGVAQQDTCVFPLMLATRSH